MCTLTGSGEADAAAALLIPDLHCCLTINGCYAIIVEDNRVPVEIEFPFSAIERPGIRGHIGGQPVAA